MGDALEQTHPPGFRCDVHEESMLMIERRLTALETRLGNVEAGQDRMEKTMRSGFNDIKSELQVQSTREVSQNGRIGELQTQVAQGTGAVGMAKFMVPLIVTLGAAVAGLIADIVLRIISG